MEKHVSIVLSPNQSNYRKVAQRNWGLTDEQMKNKHVHHYPPVSQGGRNIPEHLYVCSPSMHTHGWHNDAQFISYAAEGGKKNAGTTSEKRKKSQQGNNKGNKYWNNPITGEEKFCRECPGPGWSLGMSVTHKNNCHKPVKKRAVVCVFPDGSEVEYESAYAAAEATGKDRGDIGKCCRGQKNKTGKLRWRFTG